LFTPDSRFATADDWSIGDTRIADLAAGRLHERESRAIELSSYRALARLVALKRGRPIRSTTQ
jgi:hypothetical protein